MLRFLDANCRAGPRMGASSDLPQEPSELVAQLRRYGIARALCTHSWSEEYDPLEGNLRMADVAASHPNLTVCACVVPEASDSFPGPASLGEHLEHVSARAVRICPRAHGFEVLGPVVDGMLDVVAQLGLPLLVDLPEIGWDEVSHVLSTHPSLTMVLGAVGYREDRTVFPMLAEYPGLRIECSRYVGHQALEAVSDTHGHHRLLFGTGLPSSPPGPPMARVLFSDLSDDSKQDIAEGNLAALLGLEAGSE